MGLTDPVAKLVQVVRSSPSVIAPLIGYKKPEHMEQDLRIANVPPLNDSEFKEVVGTLLKGE
jgi:aryl-alcohol dehydrogenase-like predicted oxidoreductase